MKQVEQVWSKKNENCRSSVFDIFTAIESCVRKIEIRSPKFKILKKKIMQI